MLRKRLYTQTKRRQGPVYVSRVTALFNAIFYSTVVHLTVAYYLYLTVCYLRNHWHHCHIVKEVVLSMVAGSGLALKYLHYSLGLWGRSNWQWQFIQIYAQNLWASFPCLFLLISLSGSILKLKLNAVDWQKLCFKDLTGSFFVFSAMICSLVGIFFLWQLIIWSVFTP